MVEEKGKNFEDVFGIQEFEQILDDEFDDGYTEYEPIIYTEEDYIKWEEASILVAQEELKKFNSVETNNLDKVIEKYKVLVGLNGSSYNCVTKMIFYSLFGNQLKKNRFDVDGNLLDLRIPLFVMLKAGHGKKNYENFIKRTIRGINNTYVEPTSYHPEQFVGKVVTHEIEGETIYEAVPGFLSNDFIVIDEAYSLITSKTNEECLTYIRTALDPIGSNEITKKQVAIPEAFKLQYCPNCTIIMLSQPISNVDEKLLIKGSFRRFILLPMNISRDERDDARRRSQFLTAKVETHEEMWKNWIEFNKKLLNYKVEFVGNNNDFVLLDDYLDKLSTSLEIGSRGVRELFNTSNFTTKQMIFRMAMIRATIEHDYVKNGTKVNIKIHHIKQAISDYKEIWMPMAAWISRQMVINSDLPLGWNDQHQFLLETLKENNGLMPVNNLIGIFVNKYKSTGSSPESLKTTCYRRLSKLWEWKFVTKEGSVKLGKQIRLLKILSE